ncbi:outer membrane beta-barrel family protein [Chitinophaga sp. GbtcB8]|uniref:outer membrane beta-barrel family protein n=1 Tax=Chitinophaga sp. GbtcB8 TaxID=2824753 RepID=UPI001C304E1A|nr:outer membrane beta-barrel family protein [Chitinophaga sp. GbtcB8]
MKTIFVTTAIILCIHNLYAQQPVTDSTQKKVHLKAVEVTAKKPLLVQDIDKTVVNVDAMISSATSNTLEVLEKTPGVLVDNNGQISLNGKGVLVLIDGRSTYLSAQDLSSYLRSIPGASLDKIELIDNPSAKYDASGGAVINIRLKKNRQNGVNGNFSTSYSQGVYDRQNTNLNINYKRGKLNFFGNFNYNHERYYSADDNNRQFYTDDTQLTNSVLLQNRRQNSFRSTSLRVGMDHMVNKNTTWGFVFYGDLNPHKEWMSYRSSSLNPGHITDSTSQGFMQGQDRRKNGAANLNYQHKFNNEGRELSADLDYIRYQTPGTQHLQNNSYLPDGTLNDQSLFGYNLLPGINIYSFKADYTHPLKNKAGWEAGVKSSYVTNDNNSQYLDLEGSYPVEDDRRSNHFIYRENINAAYINARKSWRRIGVQAGLRIENTHLQGHQVANTYTPDSSFTRTYTNLFPSVFVSYKLDSAGNNTVTASINRRVSRPNYQLLNPFLFYQDNYTYTTGNPLLRAQYQTQYALKYQHRQNLGIGLQYGRFNDIIFQTTEAAGNIFITRPGNVFFGYMILLSVNTQLKPTTWWSLNANLQLAKLALKGTVGTENLRNGTSTGRLNVMNQFSFQKGWSAELSGFYFGRDIQGQRTVDPRYRVAAAAQKKILKDKGSIRLSVEDIFHTWIPKERVISIKQASVYHTNETDTQRIGIAFTYRFGKEDFARKRKHADNAAGAETERAN